MLNMAGEAVGDIELKDEIFGIEINEFAVHEVIKNYLANQRQGTQSAKTRGEVRGGGRKPFRQKGTGRGRQGSLTSPSHIGGGVVFAPKPRDYSYTVPKKVKRLALKSALSSKVKESEIIVIDSLCASLGEGLLVHKAVTLKEQGHTLEETADWIEANKLHLVHNFTVNDLFHLYRGGRVSKTAAFLGTMISLKPLLHVDDEGHLIPLSKVRGRKKSLIALVDAMEKQIGSWRDKNDIIFISHGDCIEDAQYVADLIKDRFGYESFLINHVGPTIGAHTGPGVVALFYMGDYR